MGEKKELPMAGSGGVGRREMLQGLTALGAGLAAPGGVHAHLVAPARAAAKAKAAGGALVFLDAHQFATVSRLCALIVPGADTAGADRFIDELLAVAGTERQQRFLTAFGAIEGVVARALPEAVQGAHRAAADRDPDGRVDGRVGRPRLDLGAGQAHRASRGGSDERTTLRDHFDFLKRWIADSYYTSEAGLRELGYTGNMLFVEFPDCKHPEHQ